MKYILVLIALMLVGCFHNQQRDYNHDYLIRVFSKKPDGVYYGYRNLKGDTVIPLGRYICWTDTFKKCALADKVHIGEVCIDRDEKVLFKVYGIENELEQPYDGLFRIIDNGKVGFADLEGHIKIKPQFAIAHSFKDGRARVAFDYQVTPFKKGFHKIVSKHWFLIDRSGHVVKEVSDLEANGDEVYSDLKGK